MSCIKDNIIQKYIDNEASLREITLIEKHIDECEACSLKIIKQRKNASKIKNALNLLVLDNINVPEFKVPSENKTRHLLTTKKIIFSLSAACILFFILMMPHFKETDNQEQITFVHCIEQEEIDANRSITQQEMVINVIDAEGHITEYPVE